MARGNTDPRFKETHERYIAGEGFRFDWTEGEVVKVIEHYETFRTSGIKGMDIVPVIAREVKRGQSEVLILLLDLAEKDFINRSGRGKKKFNIPEGRQSE